jgi:hypothetical protein
VISPSLFGRRTLGMEERSDKLSGFRVAHPDMEQQGNESGQGLPAIPHHHDSQYRHREPCAGSDAEAVAHSSLPSFNLGMAMN